MRLIVSSIVLLTACMCFTEICCQRGSQSAGRKRCTVQELQKCMNFLSAVAVTEGNDSALPASREELRQTCEDLKVGVKCLDKHSGLCFSQEQTMVFEDLVNPAKGFIGQLCDSGKTESEFLKHASCYKNISMDVDKCAIEYREAVKASANATGSQNPEKSIKRSCCSLRAFIQCKYDYVGQDCGSDAEVFMREHLGQITHPLLERHCAAYTFGSHACANAPQATHSGGASRRSSLDILVSFATVIFALKRQ